VGVGLALLSATLFGLSTPLVRRFGEHSGPFATAALLYVGAAAASALGGRAKSEAPVRRRHLPRVLGIAICGAVIAPVCLAWGLSRTSAMLGSLLLASEALFTVVLARILYHEHVGKRVASALCLIGVGAALLVRSAGVQSTTAAMGSLAVVLASLAWAADNALTRPLADLDPRRVVLAKSTIGGAFAIALALVARESLPTARSVVGLLVTGGLGYGTSLRLYLRAQRRIGAGRTGSIFATAPFIGAVAAYAFGDGSADWSTVAAGAVVALGIYLHMSERHAHDHIHVTAEHEHAHGHSDGHHTHAHDPPFIGEHSHVHKHAALRHDHPHGPDIHHQHIHSSERVDPAAPRPESSIGPRAIPEYG
jgi:drug/metabolite transporter (DMT)-like permease